MSLFDLMRYKISDPITSEEIEKLPPEFLKDWYKTKSGERLLKKGSVEEITASVRKYLEEWNETPYEKRMRIYNKFKNTLVKLFKSVFS